MQALRKLIDTYQSDSLKFYFEKCMCAIKSTYALLALSDKQAEK